MKITLSALCIALCFIACQSKPDMKADNSEELFKKNSATVMANLEGFQNENLDYSMYADDFVMFGTSFGSKDSFNLEEVKNSDKRLWETYDFKLQDSVVLLPGVNSETKKPDGSVRYYGNWEITLPATDSTEAKSAVVKYYESFDFDEEGKIRYQQGYGDITGVINYLHKKPEADMSMEE